MKWIPLFFFWKQLRTDLPIEEIVDEIRDFDERFGLILNKHLAVLAWWCFLHLLVGVPMLLWSKGCWWFFATMNISWAVINLLIVLKLYDHIYHKRFRKGNIYQRFQIQQHVEKMLALNLGLDVSYCFVGLYLLGWEGVGPEGMWLGFGYAVLIQGIYLLIHDLSFFLLHHQNYKQCKPFLEDVIETQIELRRQGVEA